MDYKILYNDVFKWDGFGGKLNLMSGDCKLCIFDLRSDTKINQLKQFIVVLTDTEADKKSLGSTKMTIKSCSAHIATKVTKQFNISPSRMLWIEYYPLSTYGINNEKIIPERFDKIEFTWKDGLAFHPVIAPVSNPLLKMIKGLYEPIVRK